MPKNYRESQAALQIKLFRNMQNPVKNYLILEHKYTICTICSMTQYYSDNYPYRWHGMDATGRDLGEKNLEFVRHFPGNRPIEPEPQPYQTEPLAQDVKELLESIGYSRVTSVDFIRMEGRSFLYRCMVDRADVVVTVNPTGDGISNIYYHQ